MGILFGIFLFLTIVMLVMLIGFLAIIIYGEIKDDLEEIYGKWKERRKKEVRPLPQNHAQGKGQRNRFMNLSFVYYNFIVAEESELDKRCKM